MQETYRGKELLEIASRHALETYAHGGGTTEEFIVIGTPQSIRNLSRLMEEIGQLRDRLHEAGVTFERSLDHWLNVNDGLAAQAGELAKLLKDAAVAMEGTDDRNLTRIAKRIRTRFHEKHLWMNQDVPRGTSRESSSAGEPEER